MRGWLSLVVFSLTVLVTLSVPCDSRNYGFDPSDLDDVIIRPPRGSRARLEPSEYWTSKDAGEPGLDGDFRGSKRFRPRLPFRFRSYDDDDDLEPSQDKPPNKPNKPNWPCPPRPEED